MKSLEASKVKILTSDFDYCPEGGVVGIWSDMYRDCGEYI
jgi:hypothetical protein